MFLFWFLYLNISIVLKSLSHNLVSYVNKSDYNILRLCRVASSTGIVSMEGLTRSIADCPSSSYCRTGATRNCEHPAVMDHRVTAFFHLSTRNLLHIWLMILQMTAYLQMGISLCYIDVFVWLCVKRKWKSREATHKVIGMRGGVKMRNFRLEANKLVYQSPCTNTTLKIQLRTA